MEMLATSSWRSMSISPPEEHGTIVMSVASPQDPERARPIPLRVLRLRDRGKRIQQANQPSQHDSIKDPGKQNWQELPDDKVHQKAGMARSALASRGDFLQRFGGLYPHEWRECDISIPTGSQFGDSMLIRNPRRYDYLTKSLLPYLFRDMYLGKGKGTVYMPNL